MLRRRGVRKKVMTCRPPLAATARFAVALSFLVMLAGEAAHASTVSVSCEKADMISSAWSGPMTIVYEGDASGTLKLKGPYGELTLPATSERRQAATGSAQEAQLIEGFGTTQTTMPDLALLEACIATKVAPGEEGSADSYDFAVTQCLASTPPAKDPVAVTAQVKLGIFPGEPPEEYGLVVEVKRTYDQKTKSPRGSTSIDSFPAKCTIAGR